MEHTAQRHENQREICIVPPISMMVHNDGRAHIGVLSHCHKAACDSIVSGEMLVFLWRRLQVQVLYSCSLTISVPVQVVLSQHDLFSVGLGCL